MMKKIFPAICLSIVSLLIPLFSAACNISNVTAALGQQFTLPVTKTAVITGESLKIKFVEVTGDSRCPTGVECIQAGYVKCLMLINYNDSQSSLTFTQQGDSNTVDFNIYKITFTVEPYPVYGTPIKPEDYKMIIMVNKTVK